MKMFNLRLSARYAEGYVEESQNKNFSAALAEVCHVDG
jgi:hypothetical protein